MTKGSLESLEAPWDRGTRAQKCSLTHTHSHTRAQKLSLTHPHTREHRSSLTHESTDTLAHTHSRRSSHTRTHTREHRSSLTLTLTRAEKLSHTCAHTNMRAQKRSLTHTRTVPASSQEPATDRCLGPWWLDRLGQMAAWGWQPGSDMGPLSPDPPCSECHVLPGHRWFLLARVLVCPRGFSRPCPPSARASPPTSPRACRLPGSC